MKVRKTKINWMMNFANTPRLLILIDKIPSRKDLIYDTKRFQDDNGSGILVYAEKNGYVDFEWGYDNRVSQTGALGGVFQTSEGEKISLQGAWRGSAGAVNREGFGPCIECAITTDLMAWKRGYTFFARAITVPLARILVQSIHPDLRLHEANGNYFLDKNDARRLRLKY